MSRFFIGNWEMEIIPERKIEKKYDYGIVLGGFSNYLPKNERLQFNSANDRLMQTIYLYYRGKINKIIVAGGSGKILNQEEKESVYVKEFLLNLGIPEDDVLIEDRSRNTYENALYVSNLYGNDTCTYLLITSAFHMRRALSCYSRQGLQTDPYPVNYMINPEKEKGNFWSGFLPSVGVMESWNLLLKEWLGFIVYKVRGYC